MLAAARQELERARAFLLAEVDELAPESCDEGAC
jgi:hypothetical protein